MKTFKGRPVVPGKTKAEALVSHGGFNTLASFQNALQFGDKTAKCGDQNNPDLYQKPMVGTALCLPQTIGSTTGGMVLYCAAAMERNPACMLFSKPIDSLAAAGAILADVWKFNEQLYKDKELRWNISVEEGMKNTIVSDENIVKTIVQNILEVILKSVDMGEVAINLSVPNEEFIQSKNLFGATFVMISVSCSSLLLSESDLEYMFEPYMIVDTANRKNLLRAMTLACVKNLVQALNGTVWIESKILKNTSFNIIIPQGKI